MPIKAKWFLCSCRENHNRIKQWGSQPEKQCVISYDGAAFRSLQASAFEQKDFDFAQQHLRIISGMYGLLRPLDMIQPYRSDPRPFPEEEGNNASD